jgi:hypothetical protein
MIYEQCNVISPTMSLLEVILYFVGHLGGYSTFLIHDLGMKFACHKLTR